MKKSSPIIDTIKKVMPAVVSIAISKHLEDIEKDIPPELAPLMPKSNGHIQIPDDMLDEKGMIKIGGGSGFFVDPTGIIITNKHVISDSKAEYTIITTSGEKHKAEILARDPIDDIAIIKISDKVGNFPFIKLGDSSNIELGEEVLAVGNALGLFKNTVSSGIISGLSRSIKAASEIDSKPQMQELRGLLQTDAAINPGNSGGPLVNLEGEVIGINSAIVFGAQNLGFAIPINCVKRDLSDLKKYGRIKRPLLGFRYLMLNEHLKEKMKLPISTGAIIFGQAPYSEAIIKNGPADKAKLKERDIVLAINGFPITEDKNIQDFLEEMNVGEKIILKVMRDKKTFEAKVFLEERK
ncbi:MAG: trypsin-like serine protease [Candidatus Pacebacteria bacterium]|nr:trypsin-like serine protease [Candidatus Paceibacterota bacterium]